MEKLYPNFEVVGKSGHGIKSGITTLAEDIIAICDEDGRTEYLKKDEGCTTSEVAARWLALTYELVGSSSRGLSKSGDIVVLRRVSENYFIAEKLFATEEKTYYVGLTDQESGSVWASLSENSAVEALEEAEKFGFETSTITVYECKTDLDLNEYGEDEIFFERDESNSAHYRAEAFLSNRKFVQVGA